MLKKNVKGLIACFEEAGREEIENLLPVLESSTVQWLTEAEMVGSFPLELIMLMPYSE